MWIVWTLAGVMFGGRAGNCGVAFRTSGIGDACTAPDLCLAKELFHRRREWLEADFLSLASASGKPRTPVVGRL